ncbi:MAG: acetyl-CoA hydrolase/transferase family protein [Deinococcus sp.]|nr:acetyl-CoA hydrolase/transferase family protein [Deinococcus sp.]
MSWENAYRSKLMSAEEAVRLVQSGQRITVSANAGVPRSLLDALCARSSELRHVEIAALLTLGEAPYDQPQHRQAFRANALFVGANLREAVNEGRADYTPIFLSEIPRLIAQRLPIDVVLAQVSPPDEHGFCSFGVSVDVVKPAAHLAKHVIAEVNHRYPRTLGDSFIHVSRLSAVVEVDYELPELKRETPDEVARRIGENVATLVEDGDTLQLGIGTIPDAVLAALTDKRDLGVHTEMFSDGVMQLVEAGVVNGEKKPIHRGKVVASFLMGSRELYSWVDNNPIVEMHPSDYTNDPFIVAQHDHMVAVNSAIAIDLTGQVASDSIGTYIYSGIGGQVDFVRGASRAAHGRPVIALPSTAKGSTVSRIVAELPPGAGVVTSRGDIHLVVTEHGIADLWGRSLRERAKALIAIADPRFHDELTARAHQRRLL